MQYAVSDLHGCWDKYKLLLERLNLKRTDTLYILGDMVDRGPEGLRILRDAALRPNVVPLLGNHEYAAAVCLSKLLREITEETVADEPGLKLDLELVNAWLHDGGETTLKECRAMDGAQRLQMLEDLKDLDLYAETEAGGRCFVLVHAGLGNFSPGRPLEDYSLEELAFSRPEPDDPYYEDKILVVGHTPTPLLRAEAAGVDWRSGDAFRFSDRIFRKGNFYGIDCGCVFGGTLGCLCLDTLAEIYV